MVAQILLHPVSGRNTSIITRRQSQLGSSQYNSRKPYSPFGRSCRCVTVTDRVSRAPTSGNLSIKGVIGINPPPGGKQAVPGPQVRREPPAALLGVNVIVPDFLG